VKAIEDGKGTQFDPDLVDLFLKPDVLAKIEKEMRRAHSPRGNGSNRRRRGEKAPAPDITFRWRPRSPGSHSRDRQN
jgi:hypothetical protein